MPITQRIYCSGPLFCPEERAGMARIAATLEAEGFETFLPQRDGLERFVMPLLDGPLASAPGSRRVGEGLGRAIFDLDIFQIVERCDALVINLNGRVPDEGAVAEAAVAFTLGRPVVISKDDHRAPFAGHDNSMVLGLSSLPAPIRDVSDLPQAVSKSLFDSSHHPSLPPRLRATVCRGRRIWRVLQTLPLGMAADEATRQILTVLDRL